MDFGELEMVMERFLWQSYPQHLQNTLFHAERLEPMRKKPLHDRLDQAYEFKGRADSKVEEGKWRDAITQYEFAYGLFKYCQKKDRKISMHDDAKAAREMRQEAINEGKLPREDSFTKFWLQVCGSARGTRCAGLHACLVLRNAQTLSSPYPHPSSPALSLILTHISLPKSPSLPQR